MAKKRKTRRNPVATLTADQEFELALWSSKDPEKHGNTPLNFVDAMQKRAAWFQHRDYMLTEGFGSDRPGFRPRAWWLYEKNMKPPSASTINLEKEPAEWELLLEMGEMDQGEKAQVLAEWLQMRELRPLKADNIKVLQRQAALLAEHVDGGQVAIDILTEVKKDV